MDEQGIAVNVRGGCRFHFTGDGKYVGDGGSELQRLWEEIAWRPIKGCDGRYTARGKALTRLTLPQLCNAFNVATVSPTVTCREAADGKDAADAVRLRGGGGIVTYRKDDGLHVHTLNTESGLVRKLMGIGGIESLVGTLPAGPQLAFSTAYNLLAAIPDSERTVVASATVCMLRLAAARQGTRQIMPQSMPPSSDVGTSAWTAGGIDPEESFTPGVYLLTLPPDVLNGIVSECDLPSIGSAASSCATLRRLCREQDGPWAPVCARQGLAGEGALAPRAALMRASLCEHVHSPSDHFLWEQCGTATGSLSTAHQRSPDERPCRCARCGRVYDVRLTMGFVDTAAFSSKLVTKAEFRARHEAPGHQQYWTVVWNRAAAAAAKAASSTLSSTGATGWNSGAVTFFGPQYGA